MRLATPNGFDATSEMAAAVVVRDPRRGRVDARECVRGHHHNTSPDERRTPPGPGSFTVRKVSDRTFLMQLGSKLPVESKAPLHHRDDLNGMVIVTSVSLINALRVAGKKTAAIDSSRVVHSAHPIHS